MSNSFIEALMETVINSTMIPKVQVERIVGPILSIFLEDVLQATFRNNPEFTGDVKMVCPEFPLKKTDNRQSTNIDWLMINPESKRIYLIELKTSDTSINTSQMEIYNSIKEKIQSGGGKFLIDDLQELRAASRESGKYQYVLEKKVLPFKEEITSAYNSSLIYIVPESASRKIQGDADVVLTFGMLSQSISGPLSSDWETVHEFLNKLDSISLQSRNSQISHRIARFNTKTRNSSPRWQGTLKFNDMVGFCREHGDDVIIGFTGGVNRFRNTPMDELKNRSHYKWDYASNLAGKNRSDWINGLTVVKLINQKR